MSEPTDKIPPAFIPSDALLDHELTDCAKLVLGLITTMAAGRGFWVSNATLGEWIGKSANTVSASLKALEERGYITRSFSDDGSPRVIKIRDGVLKNEEPPPVNFGSPPTEKSVAYKTSITRQDYKKDSAVPAVVPLLVDQVIEEWNQMAGRAGLPKTRGHETVRRKIAVQLKDSTWLQAFRDSLAFIEFDDWARGKNDRGWKADIEFILRPGNAHRYAEKKPGCARRSGALPEEF